MYANTHTDNAYMLPCSPSQFTAVSFKSVRVATLAEQQHSNRWWKQMTSFVLVLTANGREISFSESFHTLVSLEPALDQKQQWQTTRLIDQVLVGEWSPSWRWCCVICLHHSVTEEQADEVCRAVQEQCFLWDTGALFDMDFQVLQTLQTFYVDKKSNGTHLIFLQHPSRAMPDY